MAVPATAIAAPQTSETRGTYRLLWPDSPANPRPIERRTDVGLVFPPEVLAALIAEHPREVVSPRIAQAARDGVIVVVLWEFPESFELEPADHRVETRPHLGGEPRI